MLSELTGQDSTMSNQAAVSACPTESSSSGSSSTSTETLARRAYFVGGHPGKYVNLNDFCYKTWYEDVSTTPGPIKVSLWAFSEPLPPPPPSSLLTPPPGVWHRCHR